MMNDLEEAIGRIPLVLPNREKYQPTSHLKYIKRRALAIIDHVNAVETDMALNAVDEAHIKELEADVSTQKSSALIVSALVEGPNERIRQLEADLKEEKAEVRRLTGEIASEKDQR